MNRFSRLAAWAVVGLGALTTMGTSRAPSSDLSGTFERTLAAGETAHVTFHASGPAMDHVRALGGTIRIRAQSSGNALTILPDDSEEILSVAAGSAGSVPVADGTCPATGGCDVGLTIAGPDSGADAMAAVFLDLSVGAQNEFPAGSIIDAEED